MRGRQPISDAAMNELQSIPGVVSVGIGRHEGEQAVILGVRSESEMDAVEDAAPPQVEGLPVVLEPKGSPSPAAEAFRQGPGPIPGPGAGDNVLPAAPGRTGRERPVPGGVSIAHINKTAGTSAFLITDGADEYLTSNQHAMAPGANPIDGEVVQPGPFDDGAYPEDLVGLVENYVPRSAGALADLAWCRKVHHPDQGDIEYTRDVLGVGAPEGEPYDPQVGDTLIASGRTTGITRGEVTEVNQAVGVYSMQVTTTKMAEPGDSGSPVFYEDDQGRMRPAGIVWGVFEDENGNIGDTILSPAWAIEEESNMRIVADGRTYPWDDGGDGDTDPNPDPPGTELVVGNPHDSTITYYLRVDGSITTTENTESDDIISEAEADGEIQPGDSDTIYYDGCVAEFDWFGPDPIVDRDGNPVDLGNVVECPPATDPCAGVNCPEGEHCEGGVCVPDDDTGDGNGDGGNGDGGNGGDDPPSNGNGENVDRRIAAGALIVALFFLARPAPDESQIDFF